MYVTEVRLIIPALLLSMAVFAQETGVLRVRVILTDASGAAIPIPRAQLLISDNPATAEPKRVRTGPDGTVDVTLPAGNYTIESDVPVRLGGRGFTWTQMLDVTAGKPTVLTLDARNAEVAANLDDPGAIEARATGADASALLHKWQSSLAGIWTPTRHATGFVVDARGLIATNDRTIGDATDVEVEFAGVKVAGRVLAADRLQGIAIVRVDPAVVANRPPLAPACPAASALAVEHDQPVVTLIAPMLEPRIAVPGTAMRPTLQSFRVDWQLDPGSTGSPVFTADGAAIGITVAGEERDVERARDRRRESYVIPLSNACAVIAAAEQKMSGAKPPPPDARRTEAGLPHTRPARIAGAKSPPLPTPLIAADNFDISLMTPAMIAADHGLASPRSFLGYWASYVANAPQVLFVRVTPQFEESFWKMLARGAASTQGVALPPMASFRASFLRLRAFCGDQEVEPIRRLIIETPVQGRDAIREGFYVFAPSDFGTHCGTVKIDVFSEKSPSRADRKAIDPAIFTRLAESSR